jgi:hypothetical protein
MRVKTRSKLIEAIVKATRANGEEVFDILHAKTEQHLEKLLKVIKGL